MSETIGPDIPDALRPPLRELCPSCGVIVPYHTQACIRAPVDDEWARPQPKVAPPITRLAGTMPRSKPFEDRFLKETPTAPTIWDNRLSAAIQAARHAQQAVDDLTTALLYAERDVREAEAAALLPVLLLPKGEGPINRGSNEQVRALLIVDYLDALSEDADFPTAAETLRFLYRTARANRDRIAVELRSAQARLSEAEQELSVAKLLLRYECARLERGM